MWWSERSGFQRHGHFFSRVFPFAKLFNHLSIERWNVVRFATGHEPIIDYDFLVHPFTAGIFDVGLNVWPGSKRSAADNSGIDQHPWTVTDDGRRFSRFKKMTREFERVLVCAQCVR